MLTVKLSIDDGKGKKADLEITEADNLAKLVIIQNVFNLFGISTDVLEMTKDYQKYKNGFNKFFNTVDPIEPNDKDESSKIIDVEQRLTDGYNNNKEEIQTTYETKTDQIPEFVKTGIKTREDGTKLYRLHYRCEACYNKGNIFIYENSKVTWCQKCRHEMQVFSAHPDGFPNTDQFTNFFRAGEFRDHSFKWV